MFDKICYVGLIFASISAVWVFVIVGLDGPWQRARASHETLRPE